MKQVRFGFWLAGAARQEQQYKHPEVLHSFLEWRIGG
jgi:hypothetical protein